MGFGVKIIRRNKKNNFCFKTFCIKEIMYNNHYNSMTKFHFQVSLEKCTFSSAVTDSSLNSLTVNSKLLLPLFYMNLNTGGQRCLVKKTKKSIASFKVRPDMVSGTVTTLSSKTFCFETFLCQFKNSFLPSISRQKEGLNINVSLLFGKGSNSLCGVTVGVSDLTSLYPFFLLPSAFFNSTNIG